MSEELLNEIDDSQEKTLEWLLEQDHSEPEEKLFSLDDNELGGVDLTAQEAEMASRPMFGGSMPSDGLGSLVGEDIVMSASGVASDIYTNDSEQQESAPSDVGLMAIDARHGADHQLPEPGAEMDSTG